MKRLAFNLLAVPDLVLAQEVRPVTLRRLVENPSDQYGRKIRLPPPNGGLRLGQLTTENDG